MTEQNNKFGDNTNVSGNSNIVNIINNSIPSPEEISAAVKKNENIENSELNNKLESSRNRLEKLKQTLYDKRNTAEVHTIAQDLRIEVSLVEAYKKTIRINGGDFKYDGRDIETYENMMKRVENSRGCFISTACAISKGLSDDCEELRILRKFRDEYMSKNDKNLDLAVLYYELAPKIVENISQRSDSLKIFEEIYDDFVEIPVKLIRSGAYDDALNVLKESGFRLKDRFLLADSTY